MATMYPLLFSLLLTALCRIMGTGDVLVTYCDMRMRLPAVGRYSDVRLPRRYTPHNDGDRGKSNSRTNNLNVASVGRSMQEGRSVVASRCSDEAWALGRYQVPCQSGIEDRNHILAIAAKELGVREATGNNDGKRVEEYLAYTHLGKGYAWCAAFVSWCYGQAGHPQPRNPWAPALFPKSRTYSVERMRLPAVGRYSNRLSAVVKLQGDKVIGLQRDAGKSNSRTITQNVAYEIFGNSRRRHYPYSQKFQATSFELLLRSKVTKSPLGLEDIKSDIFGIYSTSAKRINHVGLVKEVQGKYLVTIEGNSHNKVESRRRHLSTVYAFANWVNE
ncbi:hypothetical protein G5B30_15980 [Sphingobacterium sp. SGG-5]|uniref:hypothetical protein n=1 Tax=Sphingobacterium sp. SGG-5 TaxID=2710881 RepID=UPI0013EAD295|nr:hypothetical protein [Sphingobacterium sp. SGG-5]NGM63410.1 hypothetical protein [Sphingobacterium sp. SGG-5]